MRNSCAKRCDGKTSHLKALQAEGDADDRNAPTDAKQKPRQSGPKASQKKPKNVANCFHHTPPKFCNAFITQDKRASVKHFKKTS